MSATGPISTNDTRAKVGEDAAFVAEHARLVRQQRHRADEKRRSGSLWFQLIFALVLFAFAPAIPGAHHLFGALSVAWLLAIITPAAASVVFSQIVYRRVGPGSRVYRAAEAVETALNYGVNVGAVLGTDMTWPVLWILCPFSTAFFAVTKPFETRLYTRVIVGAHGGLAVAQLAWGHRERAWVALSVGALSYAVFAVLARHGRRIVVLEAERNVARTRLDEIALDEARQSVSAEVHERIGREIEALACELDPGAAAQALSALAEMDEITAAPLPQSTCTLGQLRQRIDERCGALCTEAAYESDLSSSDESSLERLDGARAIALVRIAQELVRNAVVHGGGHTVWVGLGIDVERDAIVLVVADDGIGLSRESFAVATGGLANAASWLREHGGDIELVASRPDAPSTTLRGVLPRSS